MREATAAIGLVLVALLQVTAAPLFPLAGATVDFGLLFLGGVAVFLGPRWAMVCLPILALLMGFLMSHEPATFILAYLPLLPLAAWLSVAGTPLNRFWQTVAAVGVTGLWARSLLAAGAMASGADTDLVGLLTRVLIPGLLLDLVSVSLAYISCRIVGWEPQRISLQAPGYFSS